MYKGYLTDISGLRVGHMEDEKGLTGCTVILGGKGVTGGIDVRGSGPGTRETDVFDPKKTVDQVHAIVLTGGSAFGLNVAGGVMEYLEENDIGVDVGMTKVPIVPSAVIFDLGIGDYSLRPTREMGYLAAKNASEKETRQGNIGAGLGATVGKLLGMDYAMKSGLGSATIEAGDLKVSALVVVNAVGDIFDLDGKQIAGPYDNKNESLLNSMEILKSGQVKNTRLTNTTIGVIGTNGRLTKAQANKVAEMGHNGYARRINPIHTSLDGDTIFTLATGEVDASVDLIGSLGQEAMSRAIVNAIVNTKTIGKHLSYKDINNK